MIEITYKDPNGKEHTVMAVSAEVSVPTKFDTEDLSGEVVTTDEAYLEHHFTDASVSVEVWVWGADVGQKIVSLYSSLTEQIVRDASAPEPVERNFEAEAHEARYESPDPTPYVSYYDKEYGDAEDWLEIEPPSDDDGLDGISNDIYPDPDDLFVPTDFGG